MAQSILDSVKKAVGLEPGYTAFDVDIIMHINGALATLHQLGVGPPAGFMIEDSVPTWEDFLGPNPKLNNVKSYIYIQVRLMFDPPQTGYLVESFQKQLEELTYRISVTREGDYWAAPVVAVVPEEVILDGGSA